MSIALIVSVIGFSAQELFRAMSRSAGVAGFAAVPRLAVIEIFSSSLEQLWYSLLLRGGRCYRRMSSGLVCLRASVSGRDRERAP